MSLPVPEKIRLVSRNRSCFYSPVYSLSWTSLCSYLIFTYGTSLPQDWAAEVPVPPLRPGPEWAGDCGRQRQAVLTTVNIKKCEKTIIANNRWVLVLWTGAVLYARYRLLLMSNIGKLCDWTIPQVEGGRGCLNLCVKLMGGCGGSAIRNFSGQ